MLHSEIPITPEEVNERLLAAANHSSYLNNLWAHPTLPPVSPEVFSNLLSCLHTGHMTLSHSNVFEIFWYAQVFQFPTAVLQCQQYIQNHSKFFPPPSLTLGHSPSALSSLLQPQTKPILQTRPIELSPSTPLDPLHILNHRKDIFPYPVPQPSQAWSANSANSRIIRPTPSRLLPMYSRLTDTTVHGLQNHLNLSVQDEVHGLSCLPVTISQQMAKPMEITEPQKADSSTENENKPLASVEKPLAREKSLSNIVETEGNIMSEQNAAACDGPVKFHRIFNQFFNIEQNQNTRDKTQEEEISVDDQENETGETYTCVFCNHVFKSHYCYQKHKRRHINPVYEELQEKEITSNLSVLKDTNVQYYPCKQCGAKFPSYYFVHKHKKMWHTTENASDHSSEDDQTTFQQPGTSKQ
ncbi:uncharacterized protein LOC111703917 [Eurytemora carolleeae]|uniref:uncharacterized protein LOC111703917 n=1 Tax=Eurytemora carolleeae TaxID=1294199 RepID=UPI000C77D0CD|nr:uncharacterized protein LOC111703917 [Eurytemora carolleeae]|eukprot:XP_023331772.1 uncharacterized protein LOC111703917 [Eurytemora affinis]